MDCQKIIETFFNMLGRFEFDRAKSYIDGRKEVLHKLAPTFPNQVQLMAMLTTFSQLTEVEKHYHNQPFSNQKENHSFLTSTNFLRKTKSLKDMYHEIETELRQIEIIDANVIGKGPLLNTLRKNKTLNTLQISDKQDSKSVQLPSPGSSTSGSKSLSTTSSRIFPEVNVDISTNSTRQHSTIETSDNAISINQTPERDNQVPQSPKSAFRSSFFRVLSPLSLTSNAAPHLLSSPSQPSPSPGVVSEIYSTAGSTSGYEPPPNSSTTTPISSLTQVKEFSGELISHFCSQLQNFIQARLDMVDVYEKLTEASTRKYPSVDGISFHLSMLCRQYHKYFHHPLLAPIKEGMTLECESLMTLIRATIDMQHWRFLPTLFDLQEAQSKLNYWASNTFNKEASKRRFKVSKAQSPPRLYEWLCRFREFLVTKFTLYFHATLSRSFPPANFKSCSSKLVVDYYAKLSSYQRKIDAVFIALMYDVSNEDDFRGLGYNYPSDDYIKPQGKNTLQSMVVIPNENRAKLNSLQAEIYMIVVTNQQTILKDGHYQFHDNTKKMTYSISRPDSNVILVMVCEGQKTDRDLSMRSFALDLTNQIAFSNIFTSQ